MSSHLVDLGGTDIADVYRLLRSLATVECYPAAGGRAVLDIGSRKIESVLDMLQRNGVQASIVPDELEPAPPKVERAKPTRKAATIAPARKSAERRTARPPQPTLIEGPYGEVEDWRRPAQGFEVLEVVEELSDAELDALLRPHRTT